jgi:hypothetical protein
MMAFIFVQKPQCPLCKGYGGRPHCEKRDCGWLVCTTCKATFDSKGKAMEWQVS